MMMSCCSLSLLLVHSRAQEHCDHLGSSAGATQRQQRKMGGKPYRAIQPMFKRDRWRIFPGDVVWVNGGECKGETGKVLQVIKDKRVPQVIVEGVNLVRPARRIGAGIALLASSTCLTPSPPAGVPAHAEEAQGIHRRRRVLRGHGGGAAALLARQPDRARGARRRRRRRSGAVLQHRQQHVAGPLQALGAGQVQVRPLCCRLQPLAVSRELGTYPSTCGVCQRSSSGAAGTWRMAHGCAWARTPATPRAPSSPSRPRPPTPTASSA